MGITIGIIGGGAAGMMAAITAARAGARVTILEGNDIFTEFKGALTEQYVLQQVVSDTKYIQ
mgnify:CR=1 FL=1